MSQIKKPKFSLLIVDDDPDSMITDVEAAKGIVESLDHEFKKHEDRDGRGVITILKENMIDIIATDKNLIDDELDGIKLVSKIRAENPYVDILFYSGQGISEADRKALENFSFVEIVDDKDISNQLRTMIRKNLAKWDDISYLRGIVISLIINLEQMINHFILKYYKIGEEKIPSFKTHIVENRSFSFEGKKWALSKLIVSEDFPGLLTKLGDLQHARNQLAHSKLHDTIKNCLVIEGTDTIIDKNKVEGYYIKGKEAAKQLEDLIESTE